MHGKVEKRKKRMSRNGSPRKSRGGAEWRFVLDGIRYGIVAVTGSRVGRWIETR
jgi:hypothetical protein